MSESTVTIPGAGPVKKQWLYVGGAVAAGVIGYAYWSRAHTPAPVDPYPPADGGPLDPGATTTPGISNTPPDSSSGTLPPTTNAEWSQRAVAYMRDELSADPTTVANAIGKYLGRQPLTGPEADIIRTVWGVMGRPPVGDYPIVMVGTPPAGGSGGLAAPVLHEDREKTTRSQAALQWTAVPGADYYVVHRGPFPYSTYRVSGTSMGWMGLAPGHAYTFSVYAHSNSGQQSKSNVITVYTKH